MFTLTQNDINVTKSISVLLTSKILLLHYWLITWTLNLVENDLNDSSTLSIYFRIPCLSKWKDWKVFFTWDIFFFTLLPMKVYGTILNLCYKTNGHWNNNQQYFRHFVFLLKIYFLTANNFILVLFYYYNTHWWKPKLSNALLDLSRIHIQYLLKLWASIEESPNQIASSNWKLF